MYDYYSGDIYLNYCGIPLQRLALLPFYGALSADETTEHVHGHLILATDYTIL